jgi:hypothetical protein
MHSLTSREERARRPPAVLCHHNLPSPSLRFVSTSFRQIYITHDTNVQLNHAARAKLLHLMPSLSYPIYLQALYRFQNRLGCGLCPKGYFFLIPVLGKSILWNPLRGALVTGQLYYKVTDVEQMTVPSTFIIRFLTFRLSASHLRDALFSSHPVPQRLLN